MLTLLGRAGFTAVILLALVGLSSAVNRIADTVAFLRNPARQAAFANQSIALKNSNATDTTNGGKSGTAGPSSEKAVPDVTALPNAKSRAARSAEQQGPPRGFNDRYYAIPYWTLAHCVCGILFMVLGPMQFVAASRNRFPRFHRWCGRIFMVASLVGVFSALAFVPLLPVFGSLSTQVGVVVISAFFLVALVKGYTSVRHYQYAIHREWMIRAFAIGLGISTFRVLIPLLMVPPIRANFPEAWDTVVWLGFVINITAAEVWINLTRAPAVRPAAARVSPASLAIPASAEPI